INFLVVSMHEGQLVPIHAIAGDVYFASSDDRGKTVSPNDFQIRKLKKMLSFDRGILVTI
ncbi:hypothetical protein, partial [Paraburkholderia sp. SIMBA_027]|uniref:hypothetical protein n=1 Tax=Paraburkholderia sp. SIMBA_027 TaxID=3085770 RepID=UPI003977F91D